MNPSQQRAWLALDIGPVWRLRRSLGPARPTAELPEFIDAAASEAAGPKTAGPENAEPGSGEWQNVEPQNAEPRKAEPGNVPEDRPADFFLLPDADGRWLFVGATTPGSEEGGGPDEAPAGAGPMRLLAQMLAATGLRPGEVHHLPTGAGLSGHIGALAPQLIVALGTEAARLLLQADASLASLRTQPHAWRLPDTTIPLVVTWHPAALLAMPQRKAQAWEDLCRARAIAAEVATGRGPIPGET